MEENAVTIAEEIKSDPRLGLLAQAIMELSEKQMTHDLALKTIHFILAEQQNSMRELNDSLQKVGEVVDLIIKQMFVISHHPAVPTAFKGVVIK